MELSDERKRLYIFKTSNSKIFPLTKDFGRRDLITPFASWRQTRAEVA